MWSPKNDIHPYPQAYHNVQSDPLALRIYTVTNYDGRFGQPTRSCASVRYSSDHSFRSSFNTTWICGAVSASTKWYAWTWTKYSYADVHAWSFCRQASLIGYPLSPSSDRPTIVKPQGPRAGTGVRWSTNGLQARFHGSITSIKLPNISQTTWMKILNTSAQPIYIALLTVCWA